MPQREILWNVPPAVLTGVYALSALSTAWIVYWFYRRACLWKRGTAQPEPRSWLAGLARLGVYLAGHRKIRADRFAGIMHLLVFWGFIVLLIATTLVGIQHHFQLVFLTGWTYLLFSLAADLGGLAFCVGTGMALWRRVWRIETRLQPSRVHAAVLWLLLAIGVSGFVLEGARILAWDFPAFEVWSPIGYLFALALAWLSTDAAVALHLALWISHAALVIVFFLIVPVSILKHILLGAYSVAFPAGRLGMLNAPVELPTSAVDLPQLRTIDWLQADACLTCGLCTQACPAFAAGKPLSPRSIVLGLRAHLDSPQVPLTVQVADDALWSCTACNACDAACPINIRILDKIVALRRGRVATGELPEPAVAALESTAQKFNPFGQANSSRLDWASGLHVPVAKPEEKIELLYWVGCAGAFDPSGREVARAMVRILNHTRISFHVLGCAERCTGDPARRLGEEGLWQELAQENRRTLARHGVQAILTHCPHCYHAFANEYAELGSMPRVLHHSQWLQEKLADGTIKVNSGDDPITFHDPCYLGRVNDQTVAPRIVLDMVAPGRQVEMADHGRQSLCCGGGGGQIWLDVKGRTRVETMRAWQAEQTGAHTVATGCPFCRVMLEAGRGGLAAGQGNWRVRDLAELVAERLV
ncbi:MAG: 4Fe-4S dicluster domain-containing protein [Planctomycetes bacterium]|nr:4Fe-4S dicluster domain-containing protein [Planctomycetota bacterium]